MRQTNNLATVSLIAGIIGWTAMPLIGSIVAIVTGHLARKQIRESHGMEEGNGLALGGLVLGYLHVAAWIVGVLVWVLAVVGIIGLGFLGAIL